MTNSERLTVEEMFQASSVVDGGHTGAVGWKALEKCVSPVVVTSAASPHNFHLIFDSKSASDTLADLTDRMSVYYNTEAFRKESALDPVDYSLPGKVFACAFRAPGQPKSQPPIWARAMVECSVHGMLEYKVLLIDFGRTLTVHRGYLRKLRSKFAAVQHPAASDLGDSVWAFPCLATKCSLFGLKPVPARSATTTTDINRNKKDDDGGQGMVHVASSFEINERFVKTLRDKGGQFIALRPPSILAGGNGILLIHVKIKAPIGAATTEKSAANAGSASAVGGAVDPNEASQPAPRGSRKAEVVATCINKMLYEAGDAILDPEDGRGKAMLQQWESYEQDVKRWLYHDRLSYHAAFGKKKLLKTYGNYCL